MYDNLSLKWEHTMWIVFVIVVILLFAVVLYEYRFRKPDQLILCETKDGFGLRKGRMYPRHFSLPITRTTHSFVLTVDASAKGNLDIRVKLAVTVAASLGNIADLIRIGGWNAGAVVKAAKELEGVLLGLVKEYTEKYEVEELSSEKINEYLNQKIHQSKSTLGLEVLTMAVHSFEPVNPQISEAIRQREHARIMEQTEMLNQKARIAAAKTKIKADEEIALLENELELKKYDLEKIRLEKESTLSSIRVGEEIKRDRMRLELDKEELELLKNSPELLMLTPQAARLAEASQNLKNARTIVSLGPNEAAQGVDLLGMFQKILQNTLETYRKKKEGK